jgi:hypothetical protein
MILITIPHAGEGDNKDEGATIFINHLERALENQKVEYETLVGKTSREIIDLNRTDGYGTDFYNDFISKLPGTSVHIDLHSFFPSNKTTEHGYSLQDWGEKDITLFNIPDVTDEELLQRFIDIFEDREIETVIQPALFENFLTNVASALFDTPSILIEINEEAGQNFDSLASAVVEVVAGYSADSAESEPVAEPTPV